ncbi:MAG: DNA polymerase III subunit gamma/tau [Bacilli bacterium]
MGVIIMYQALYRKYRPLYFNDVVGQDVIVTTLKNTIKYNKINHAYLFSGPRGTGKTSVAKLFARSVNCLDSKNGEACGKCLSCLSSFSKECVDIIEIDAASNNGIDEIRDLRSKVYLTPTLLTYKVYIIDEVHMLSIGAFNALLKTLEEPPHHAIFILATTDPHKVPNTIISRCQCFSFKKINQNALIQKLSEVATKEQINIETNVLEKIASFSDGGLRDALGLLDKLSSYSTEQITLNDFQKMNGLLNGTDIEELFTLIFLDKDIKKVLLKLDQWNMIGYDFIQINDQFIDYLSSKLKESYFSSSIDKNFQQNIYTCLLKLNKTLYEMKNVGNPRILFELSILNIINEDLLKESELNITVPNTILNNNVISNTSNHQQIEVPIEAPKKSEISIEKVNLVKKATKNYDELFKVRINNTFAEATKEDLTRLKAIWNKLNDYVFDTENGYLACMLLDGTIRAASYRTILISFQYDSLLEKAKDCFDSLEEKFNFVFNLNCHLAFLTDDDWISAKKEYIEKLNKNYKYIYIEENNKKDLESPSSKFIETTKEEKDDIINNNDETFVNNAMSLFGDKIEIVK